MGRTRYLFGAMDAAKRPDQKSSRAFLPFVSAALALLPPRRDGLDSSLVTDPDVAVTRIAGSPAGQSRSRRLIRALRKPGANPYPIGPFMIFADRRPR
jgi:hypothetical protein